MTALTRVPACALSGGVALFVGARLLERSLGDSALGAIGAWSLTLIVTVSGVVLGSVLGLAMTGQKVLQTIEADIRGWLTSLPIGEGDRLVPRVHVQELRSRYDHVTEAMYRSTVGRIPLPGRLARAVHGRFRQVLVEEFLGDCAQRGVTSVGFPEARDFVLRKGLPIVTRPAHAQVRVWTVATLALLGVGVAVPALIALLRTLQIY